jgi:hypothetical protein
MPAVLERSGRVLGNSHANVHLNAIADAVIKIESSVEEGHFRRPIFGVRV